MSKKHFCVYQQFCQLRVNAKFVQIWAKSCMQEAGLHYRHVTSTIYVEEKQVSIGTINGRGIVISKIAGNRHSGR